MDIGFGSFSLQRPRGQKGLREVFGVILLFSPLTPFDPFKLDYKNNMNKCRTILLNC